MLSLLPRNQMLTLFKRPNITPAQQQSIIQTLQAMPNAKRLMLLSLLMRMFNLAQTNTTTHGDENDDLANDPNTQSFSFTSGDAKNPLLCTYTLPMTFSYNNKTIDISYALKHVAEESIHALKWDCPNNRRGRERDCTKTYVNKCGILNETTIAVIGSAGKTFTFQDWYYQGVYVESATPIKIGSAVCGFNGAMPTGNDINQCVFDAVQGRIDLENSRFLPTYFVVLTWIGILTALALAMTGVGNAAYGPYKAKMQQRKDRRSAKASELMSILKAPSVARDVVEAEADDDVVIDIDIESSADEEKAQTNIDDSMLSTLTSWSRSASR